MDLWYPQWPAGWTPLQSGNWTTQATTYVVPQGFSDEDIKRLLNAKNGELVPVQNPERIIYMGEAAYGAYEAYAICQMEKWQSGPTMRFLGIEVVCTKHLRPWSIICADLHIQNELGDILKDRFQERIDHMVWFKDQQRGNQATSTYRLEEPNRILAMVFLGLVISWLLGLLYAWKIGLLVLGR